MKKKSQPNEIGGLFIVNYMSKLGFMPNQFGCCAGFSGLFIEAIVTNKITELAHTLDFICKTPHLVERVNRFIQKYNLIIPLNYRELLKDKSQKKLIIPARNQNLFNEKLDSLGLLTVFQQIKQITDQAEAQGCVTQEVIKLKAYLINSAQQIAGNLATRKKCYSNCEIMSHQGLPWSMVKFADSVLKEAEEKSKKEAVTQPKSNEIVPFRQV